jgi:hypothetical protein
LNSSLSLIDLRIRSKAGRGIDRGRNVRDPEGYGALSRDFFDRIEGVVIPKAFPPWF